MWGSLHTEEDEEREEEWLMNSFSTNLEDIRFNPFSPLSSLNHFLVLTLVDPWPASS